MQASFGSQVIITQVPIMFFPQAEQQGSFHPFRFPRCRWTGKNTFLDYMRNTKDKFEKVHHTCITINN